MGQALLTEVAGEDAWRSFPEALRAMFTYNGPAILAELRGGMLRTDRDAARAIEQPVLLVTAADSLPGHPEANEVMASVLPDVRTEIVGGGHLVDPSAPEVLAFIREVLERP